MIGDAILSIFGSVAGVFLAMLPMGALMAGLTLPNGWLYGYSILNAFLPVSEILFAVSALLAIRMLMMSVRAMVFVKNLVPFV